MFLKQFSYAQQMCIFYQKYSKTVFYFKIYFMLSVVEKQLAAFTPVVNVPRSSLQKNIFLYHYKCLPFYQFNFPDLKHFR